MLGVILGTTIFIISNIDKYLGFLIKCFEGIKSMLVVLHVHKII